VKSGKIPQNRKIYNSNTYNIVVGYSHKNVIRAIKKNKEYQMETACGNFGGRKKCLQGSGWEI
jgi:hypothetical protein